jgi:hypothetical protein
MTAADIGLGTRVLHRCDLSHPMFDGSVTHVVLLSRRPCSTPMSDIRGAGFDIVGTGLLPEEIDGCDAAVGYGNCQHLLVRPS